MRRTAAAQLGIVAAGMGLLVAPAPAAQAAPASSDLVYMTYNAWFKYSAINFWATRGPDSPGGTVRVVATETADTVTLTVTDPSAVPDFTAREPCRKTTPSTAVCPRALNGFPTIHVEITANAGDNDITMDLPTLSAGVSLGSGNDVVRVPHSKTFGPLTEQSSTVNLGAGDDTYIGGTGPVTVYGEQGRDTIHAFSAPAVADLIYCGGSAVEPPSDTVVLDGKDVLANANCLAVTTGS